MFLKRRWSLSSDDDTSLIIIAAGFRCRRLRWWTGLASGFSGRRGVLFLVGAARANDMSPPGKSEGLN